jgi:hypothetical protein
MRVRRWDRRDVPIALATALAFSACSAPVIPGRNFVDLSRRPQAVLTDLASTPNELRLLTFGSAPPRLGQCATQLAGLLGEECVPSPGQLDTTLRADLGSGEYRFYQRAVDVDGSGNAGVTYGVASAQGSASLRTTRHQLVIEWSRFRTTPLPLQNAPAGRAARPHVTAIDVGIAVRIIFDVTLTTTSAQLSANFGIANLATSLATNQATVMVSYNSRGTVIDLLPRQSPVSIPNVDTLVAVENAFYRAVQALSDAWMAYAGINADGTPQTAPAPSPPAQGVQVAAVPAVQTLPRGAAAFNLQPIAYYVSNLTDVSASERARYWGGYLAAMREIGAGRACAEALDRIGRQDGVYRSGFFRAYADVLTAVDCTSAAPSSEQQQFAEQVLTYH